MSSLSNSSVVSRKELLASDLSETETVMLDIEQGRYFGVKGVANAIWGELANPVSVKDLCLRLRGRYEVDEETCESEVLRFLDLLHDQDLLKVWDPTVM